MRIVRRMHAKYPGQCRCGSKTRSGDRIGYYREQGRGHVMCSVCFERWERTCHPSRHDGGMYVQRETQNS